MTHPGDKIRVAIAGASGKMGQEAIAALFSDPRFTLSGVLMRRIGQAHGDTPCAVYDDAEALLQASRPDVWLDLTDAQSVVRHIDLCISYGVRPVIGATGYSLDDIERWNFECLARGIGGIAVPNFAIGALLMMRFAAEAARFFPDVEVIELHHDEKKDAPSGTAKRTAESISQQRLDGRADLLHTNDERGLGSPRETNASRGFSYHGVPIHSVRLPGLVAHQQVLFGGTGEVLTIRHDSMSRSSFMPGVLLACARVGDLKGLTYGLESLLW